MTNPISNTQISYAATHIIGIGGVFGTGYELIGMAIGEIGMGPYAGLMYGGYTAIAYGTRAFGETYNMKRWHIEIITGTLFSLYTCAVSVSFVALTILDAPMAIFGSIIFSLCLTVLPKIISLYKNHPAIAHLTMKHALPTSSWDICCFFDIIYEEERSIVLTVAEVIENIHRKLSSVDTENLPEDVYATYLHNIIIPDLYEEIQELASFLAQLSPNDVPIVLSQICNKITENIENEREREAFNSAMQIAQDLVIDMPEDSSLPKYTPKQNITFGKCLLHHMCTARDLLSTDTNTFSVQQYTKEEIEECQESALFAVLRLGIFLLITTSTLSDNDQAITIQGEKECSLSLNQNLDVLDLKTELIKIKKEISKLNPKQINALTFKLTSNNVKNTTSQQELFKSITSLAHSLSSQLLNNTDRLISDNIHWQEAYSFS